jgi:uncharacterized protein (TIGR01777 family)
MGPVGAVVHLAGAGIADRRWTDAYKKEILDSRVGPTRALSAWLASRPQRPATLICASAIGFYGNRDDEALDERSAAGNGFLAEVCVAWERAADPARDAGVRVVHLRTGIVLSRDGGALAKMLPAFRAGVGGPLGSGEQFMSWVSVDDYVAGTTHAIGTSALAGPVNITAPMPVTSREFAEVLARVLHRPALFRVPAVAVRTLFGEMGQALLLDGQRVLPAALLASGYVFRHQDLEDALRHALGR